MKKLPLITNRSAVEIRGVYGQSVLDLYEQLHRLLLQETKSRVVGDLFAEPQVNSLRGEITWYTQATGAVQRFDELSETEQEQLWLRLTEVRDQIKAVGEQYIARGGQTAFSRADTFRAMLTVTDINCCLFSVGGQPVLCEWGCDQLGHVDKSLDLWSIGARRDVPVPVSGSAPGSDTLAALRQPAPESVPEPAPDVPDQTPEPPAPRRAQQVPRAAPEVSREEPQAPRAKPLFAEPPPKRQEVRAAPPGRHAFIHSRKPGEPLPQRTGGEDRAGCLWPFLKLLILALLLAILLAALLRACDGTPAVAATPAQEQALRTEIAGLRERVSEIAEQCERSQAALTDTSLQQRLTREQRTLAGALSVALQWNGSHDLDLYVRDPSGRTTGPGAAGTKDTTSEARLNLDMNYLGNKESMSDEPVEVITWEQAPPAGKYVAGVRLFRAASTAPDGNKAVEFQLVVTHLGKRLVEKSGSVPLSMACQSDQDACTTLAITTFDL